MHCGICKLHLFVTLCDVAQKNVFENDMILALAYHILSYRLNDIDINAMQRTKCENKDVERAATTTIAFLNRAVGKNLFVREYE